MLLSTYWLMGLKITGQNADPSYRENARCVSFRYLFVELLDHGVESSILFH